MALLSAATLAIGLYSEPWWRIAELAAATLTGARAGA
jgi:hypothetical protein